MGLPGRSERRGVRGHASMLTLGAESVSSPCPTAHRRLAEAAAPAVPARMAQSAALHVPPDRHACLTRRPSGRSARCCGGGFPRLVLAI